MVTRFYSPARVYLTEDGDLSEILYDGALPQEYLDAVNEIVRSESYSEEGGLISRFSHSDEAYTAFVREHVSSASPVVKNIDGKLRLVVEVESDRALPDEILDALTEDLERQYRDDWGEKITETDIPLPGDAVLHKHDSVIGAREDMEKSYPGERFEPLENPALFIRVYGDEWFAIWEEVEQAGDSREEIVQGAANDDNREIKNENESEAATSEAAEREATILEAAISEAAVREATILEAANDEAVISVVYIYSGVNNERVSEVVDFPAAEETIESLLANAGINGVDERVFYVEEYKSEIKGLADALDEVEGGIHPAELNYLAEKLSEMDTHGRELFETALEVYRNGCSIEGLQDFAHRIVTELEARPAPDKRKIQDYDITHSVRLDGVDIIVAENPKSAAEPYMLCERDRGPARTASALRRRTESQTSYHIVDASADYLKIMQGFADKVSAHVSALRLDKIYAPKFNYPLTGEDCVAGGLGESLEGKVIAIKTEVLAPEFRSATNQLMLAQSGSGCSPTARGNSVYCAELYTGREVCHERYDVLGVVRDECIPEWAKAKLAALGGKSVAKAKLAGLESKSAPEGKTPELDVKTGERESVRAKIIAARKQPSAERKPKSGRKSDEPQH